MKTKTKCPNCGNFMERLYHRLVKMTTWGYHCKNCRSLYWSGVEKPTINDLIIMDFVNVDDVSSDLNYRTKQQRKEDDVRDAMGFFN